MRTLALILLAMAYALASLSVGLNVAFGLTITEGDARYIYAAAGGLTDVIKLLIPAFFVWCLARQIRPTWRAWLPALTVWLVATAYSVIAAAGLFEVLRDNRVANVKLAKTTAADTRSERDWLRRELADMAGQLAAMRGNHLYSRRRSNACTNATARSSKAFCANYKRLETDHRRAAQRLRAITRRLERPSEDVHRGVDPATKMWASIAGLDPARVRALVALIFGALLEFTAALVPSIVAPALIMRRSAPLTAKQPRRAPTPPEPSDDVQAFATAALRAKKGESVGAGVIFDLYKRWATDTGRKSMTQTAFGKRMVALGYKKEKRGRVVYIDVVLAVVSEKT